MKVLEPEPQVHHIHMGGVLGSPHSSVSSSVRHANPTPGPQSADSVLEAGSLPPPCWATEASISGLRGLFFFLPADFNPSVQQAT